MWRITRAATARNLDLSRHSVHWPASFTYASLTRAVGRNVCPGASPSRYRYAILRRSSYTDGINSSTVSLLLLYATSVTAFDSPPREGIVRKKTPSHLDARLIAEVAGLKHSIPGGQ